LRDVDYLWPSADGTNGQILSTNANGVLSWATDGGGNGTPDLIYSLVGGTKYFTASSTATDNLAWRFGNGFVSAASSTINSSLNVQTINASSTATSTFGGVLAIDAQNTPILNTTLLQLSSDTNFASSPLSIDWFNENESEIMFRMSVEPGSGYDAPLFRILSGDGAGVLTSDFVIDSLGNVGLGLVAPAEQLDIVGAMHLTPQASPPGTANSGDIYVDSTASPDELCFYDGAAWQGISSGTDGNCA